MIESYSEQQARALYYTGIPFAIISMMGSILIFILFYRMYGGMVYSSGFVKRYSAIKPIHEFVLLIAVCNLIGSIGNILGVGEPYSTNITLCKFRETLAVFGGFSSFQLSWIMSYIMYMTIFYPKSTLYLKLLLETKTRRIIEITIAVFSLIITFSPFGLYCSDNAHSARLVFYIPMVITLAFISFCYLSICSQRSSGVLDENMNAKRIYRNVRLYPGVMLFCLASGTVRRIYNVATDGNEPPFVFAVIQVIAMYSYGALISAVYVYNLRLNDQKIAQEDEEEDVNDVAMNEIQTLTNHE